MDSSYFNASDLPGTLYTSAVPSNIRLGEVKKKLMVIEHVRSVHDTHVWALTAGKTVLSAHLVIGTYHSFRNTNNNQRL